MLTFLGGEKSKKKPGRNEEGVGKKGGTMGGKKD